MTKNKKLIGECEQELKKIDDVNINQGCKQFEDTLSKISTCSSSVIKQKLEDELKGTIKKLQKFF